MQVENIFKKSILSFDWWTFLHVQHLKYINEMP